MNFEHIYGGFNEQEEVDLSYLDGEHSRDGKISFLKLPSHALKVKVEVSQKEHLKREESEPDESMDSPKASRPGMEGNRQWKKKRQSELKAQIKARFYSLYNEVKRAPPISEKLCQEILNEVSLRGLSVLGLEELSRYFEKLLTKSVVNPRYGKKNWTEEETEFLISVVAYYAHLRDLDYRSIGEDTWEFLGSIFPTKGFNLVRKKWRSMLKANLSKHPWNQKEDDLLARVIAQYGTESKWKKIAEEFNKACDGTVYRHSKQCRERWINHLDPSMKRGDWNDDDDAKLLMGIVKIGRKWSEIAKFLGDRTENAVKNRWHSITKMYRSLRNSNDPEDGANETVEQEFAFAVLEELRRTKKIELPTLTKEESKVNSKGSQPKSKKDEAPKSPKQKGTPSSTIKMKSTNPGRRNLLEQNLAMDEQKVKKEEGSFKKIASLLGGAASALNPTEAHQSGLLNQPAKTSRHSHSALEGLYPQNLPYPTPQSFPFEGAAAAMDPLKSNLMQATNPLQLPFLPRHQSSSFTYSSVQGSQTQSTFLPMINGLPYYGNNHQSQIPNPNFFPQQIFPDKTMMNNHVSAPIDISSESMSSSNQGNNVPMKNLKDSFNGRKWDLSTKRVDINTLRLQISSAENQIYFALIDFKESEIHLLDRATLNNYQQSLDTYNRGKTAAKEDPQLIPNPVVPVRDGLNSFSTQHNTFSSVFSQNNLVMNPFIPNLLKNQPNYPYGLNQNNRPANGSMYPQQDFNQEANHPVYQTQFNLGGQNPYPQEAWQQNLE